MVRRLGVLALLPLLAVIAAAQPRNPSTVERIPTQTDRRTSGAHATAARVRFAQFNIFELSRAKVDEVDAQGRGANVQLRKAAEIVQRVRPDVLLVNEIDSNDGDTARHFLERYLAVGQGGQQGVRFPHVFTAPVNTGVPSGLDLNNNGSTGDPDDGWGYGRYPGQYGMAVYSAHPIEADAVRTFRMLRWADMPGHHMPDGREGRPQWYSAEAAAALRLSSKSHWDLPVQVGGRRVHLICAHPTPGIFDGPEDRNGRRNFDEIRLVADYLRGGDAAAYIVDDGGRRGAIAPDALFVVMGDFNSDPARDEAPYGRRAMDGILTLPAVQDPAPVGAGSTGDGAPGPPRFLERRTSEYGRIDYVLPSRGMTLLSSGVFWPAAGDPLRALVDAPDPASDHRLVYVDVSPP